MTVKPDYTLLTDLYQLTMAQGYWETGKADVPSCFSMYFRENPFEGGFAIACGLAQVADMVETFGFSKSDIDYLASLDAPGGGRLFKLEFLEYLQQLTLEVDIDAVYEGTVVFAREPLVRVTGPVLQCQLLETALLNCVNFQTLIATKAARVCMAADAPVAEFGLRRAQGAGGGLWASRASIVGGCSSTSNVLAGKLYGIPVSGTHAHSWIGAFDNELEAFRAYARTMPQNCTLLVDTYDVIQGIENAIIVGKEMKERGEKLAGIRIDSGDLAWLSKVARKRLNEEGLEDCSIILSNDLDEYTIESLKLQGSQADAYGVGTRLATGYDQPTLGGVYKLSAIQDQKTGEWHDRIKVSEQTAKLTIPGVLNVRRYFDENGKAAGDMVYDINRGVSDAEKIVDPVDSLRQKRLKGKTFEMLLHPLAREGDVVLEDEYRDALAAQARAKKGLTVFDESQRRLLNPHSYPVGLECGLFERRHDLVVQLRGIQ